MSLRNSITLLLLLACSPSQPKPSNVPEPAPPQAAAEPTPPQAPVEPAAPEATAAPAPHAHSGGADGFHKDFSDADRFAKHFDDPERDAWQRPTEVIAQLHLEPGQVVVDLGAGTGYFLPALSRAVGPEGRVLALDVEPKMIEHLGRRVQEQGLGNVTPRQVAADDPGLDEGSVARVLIVNTWHHLDDRAEYARKLARALAPDGEILIVDFTLDSDLGPPARHRLAPGQVVAELQGGGLRAEVIEPEQLPKQYLVRARRGCATCKAKH
jgi:SAM-dependent methyltransferase